jgi:hypothetical protein
VIKYTNQFKDDKKNEIDPKKFTAINCLKQNLSGNKLTDNYIQNREVKLGFWQKLLYICIETGIKKK